MQIKVLLFGITRDLIGKGQLIMHADKKSTIALLKHQLETDYPELGNYAYTVAVNEVYADENQVLTPNDTVALIPPVSGG